MAGDTANAAQWANADVYIGDGTQTNPTDVTTAWGAGWSAVGLLDGEEGFVEARDDDSNEFFAWGGLLVKRTKSKHKRTITFVALEDNPTVFNMVNPGSTRTTTAGVTNSTVKVPIYPDFPIGFEVRDGKTVKRRMVQRATIEKVDDVKEGEANLTVYQVTVLLYPQSDGTLYTEIKGDLP